MSNSWPIDTRDWHPVSSGKSTSVRIRPWGLPANSERITRSGWLLAHLKETDDGVKLVCHRHRGPSSKRRRPGRFVPADHRL